MAAGSSAGYPPSRSAMAPAPSGYPPLRSAMVPATSAFELVLPYEGILQKQSEWKGCWQPRRVVVDRGSFSYHKDGCQEARLVLGKGEIVAVAGQLPSIVLVYAVLTGGEERCYRLRAENAEDMHAWMSRIASAFDIEVGHVHEEEEIRQVSSNGAEELSMANRVKSRASSWASSAWQTAGKAVGQALKATGTEEYAAAAYERTSRAKAQLQEQVEQQMENALTSSDDGKIQLLLDKALSQGLTGEGAPTMVRKAARRAAGRTLRDATAAGDPKKLKGALLAARRLQAVDVPEFQPALAKYKEVRQLPEGWDISKMLAERQLGRSKLHSKSDVSHDYALRGLIQLLFNQTYSSVTTRDRKGEPVPLRYEVVQVAEVQNESQWVDYMVRREGVKSELKSKGRAGRAAFVPVDVDTRQAFVFADWMASQKDGGDGDHPLNLRVTVPLGARTGDTMYAEGRVSREPLFLPLPEGATPGTEIVMREPLATSLPGPPLDASVNEVWLFHGTWPIAAEKIASDDFRIDLAGTSTGTLYGRGIYMAESCTKADEYSKKEPRTELYTMILCRVTLGTCLYTAEKTPDARKCEDACISGDYHAVLGDRKACRGTYREFVVFDEDQVYPNYVIQYRRVMPPSTYKWA